MSAILYDKSLVDKLKLWTKDTNIKITSPDETRQLFKMLADETNDKPIDLPLVALRRTHTTSILNTRKRPLSFSGVHTNRDAQGNLSDKAVSELCAIPIQLNYQIDIYTRFYEEAEEYVRNFIFNLINYPKLTIQIPYNSCNIEQNSYVRLNGDVQDNSDIPERLMPGQFTRKTISIYIDDAYFYSYPTKKIWHIDGDVEVAKFNEGEK